MDPRSESQLIETRRQFFGRSTTGIGSLALASLLNPQLLTGAAPSMPSGIPRLPAFAAKAKRVIYLLQSGAPSQMELFDYKPTLKALHGKPLPESVREGQRLTGMTARQKTFPIVNPPFAFKQHGKSGTWISDLLPHLSKVADDLCIVKSMHTEAINHDPAITFFQTGNQQPGRPSIGSWFSYGLGSENEDLPAFVVLLSKNSFYQAQPIYSRLWGSGFLPSNHQGVKLRSQGDPVLYLNDPAGNDPNGRRKSLDALAELNRIREREIGDPEIRTRIAAYEMAYRMQTSVPELADLSTESESTFKLYGEEAKIPGTHAANCLMARRLAERNVRFIQVFHRGWDHHSNLAKHIPVLSKETDQGTAALITDLKQRGLLDDTLVIWGGEFGRTVYSQGGIGNYGRDHHPRCFSVFFAGGGVKGGMSYGSTDDFCYNIAENPVHVHDFHATILHQMGVNHEKLTYRFQGRDYRLTDVHGNVVKGILA
jgi:hypothetical protein